MERTLIAPGVHLSCDPASKFNRCRISIHFAFPAQRKTATAHALLPLVMERGYADCPDMTRLTKKLAKLYGADLTVDARPMGCNHNLCVSVTGIKDAFALEGEALTAEYTKIALGAAFHPYLVDGCFDPQAVSIEKQMLKKGLEDEINDKRIYCLHQANREFFGDSPAGVRQEGYLDEVDGLTPAMLTAAYRQMLRTANIELLVLGCDTAQTLCWQSLPASTAPRCRWWKTWPCLPSHRCTRPKTTIWCRQNCVCCSHWGSPCSRSSWQRCALPWRCTAAA